MKIVRAIFQKMKILIFFLMWITLNFEGRSKTKNRARHTCKGTLDIECELDWSVNFGAMLDDADRKLKTIFQVLGTFPGKADSVILLSVTSPMSQFILQPFRRFTYVTARSPILPLLHLRHTFSNPSFASPTSHALHLRQLTSHPWTIPGYNLTHSQNEENRLGEYEKLGK